MFHHVLPRWERPRTPRLGIGISFLLRSNARMALQRQDLYTIYFIATKKDGPLLTLQKFFPTALVLVGHTIQI